MKNHTFNRDASFIIIEQIRNSTLSRETKKNLLKGKLLDLEIRDFKTKRSQPRKKEVKRMHFHCTQPSSFFSVF